jgi:hypothetical protein
VVNRWSAAVAVGLLGTSAAVGVMVCFGLDAAEGRVAASVVGLWVGVALLAVWLRRRAARRAEYPRTLVYDPEAGGWVVASPLRLRSGTPFGRRRAPRVRS